MSGVRLFDRSIDDYQYIYLMMAMEIGVRGHGSMSAWAVV